MTVNLLVEGAVDEAVGRRLLTHAGYLPGACYGKRGIGYVKSRIDNFNRTAIGPFYNPELSRFAWEHWDLHTARCAAPSLDRCLRALERLRG